MRRIVYLIVLSFLLTGSAHAQDRSVTFYKDTYRKGFVSLHTDTAKYQKIFFDTFPSNFKAFKKLYGWSEDTKYGRTLTAVPRYFFKRFFEINCVSHKALTKKIVDVSINGVYDADAISLFQHTAFDYANTYNKEFITELQTRSRAAIVSVWAFYFDYQNDIYRKGAYDKIVKATMPNDKKMVALITAGYKKAIARHKKH